MKDHLQEFTPEEQRRACRLLREEQAQEGRAEADLDENAEYRMAICHFPEWLDFPYPVDPDRLGPER